MKQKNVGRFFTAPVIITLALLALVILASIFAPLVAPYNPEALDMAAKLQMPTAAHLLGTDNVGRDILSRLIFGSRITLLSALAVVVISVIIGIPLGLVSGYYGGRLDNLIMEARSASGLTWRKAATEETGRQIGFASMSALSSSMRSLSSTFADSDIFHTPLLGNNVSSYSLTFRIKARPRIPRRSSP